MPPPIGQTYPLLFYGLHVCYAGVNLKRYHCTAVMENIGEWENTCLPKTCLFLKNAQTEKSNFFAFQLHFLKTEHIVLGIMQFFF